MKKEEDITIHLTLRERIALHRGLAACLSGKNIDPEARGALSYTSKDGPDSGGVSIP